MRIWISVSWFDSKRGSIASKGVMGGSYLTLLSFNQIPRKGISKKEKAWRFKVGSTENQERCTRLYVQIVKKNAKSLSSLGATSRFIAEIVIPSARMAAGKRAVPV